MDRKTISLDERIILALDLPSARSAKALVREVEGEVRFFKVGLQLFLSEGFSIVEWLKSRGHRVMLDLKFYDIPKTVELACRQLNGRNITFATVHGYKGILEAAATAAKDFSVLAVTVLTSLGREEIEEMKSPLTIEELVRKRAKWAKSAGCHGVVCSPLEARSVRKEVGEEMFIVTPGIRPSGPTSTKDDQRRVQTPYAAIMGGADFLVIGRPVTGSREPLNTVKQIKDDISKAIEALANR